MIVTPRQSSGGPLVLHALCRELEELGHEAQVFHAPRYDFAGHEVRYWLDMPVFLLYDFFCMLLVRLLPFSGVKNAPALRMYAYPQIKGCRRRLWPFVDKETVVVYPELVSGNPLYARRVVRWFLYFHPFAGRDDVFKKEDLFFCYQDTYNDPAWNPVCRTFKIQRYDLDLYKQTNFSERTGTCYIVRKGKDRPDLPKEWDGIVIDDLPEPEKVKVLNQCKYCVSYDMYTAYMQIAALCGCIPVAVPEPGKTKEDYGSEYKDRYGVAFGMDEAEIEYAVRTRGQAVEKYRRMNREARESVRRFAQECEAYFAGDAAQKRSSGRNSI